MLQGNNGLCFARLGWWTSTDLTLSEPLQEQAPLAPMAKQHALLGLCAADDLPGSCPALLLHGW